MVVCLSVFCLMFLSGCLVGWLFGVLFFGLFGWLLVRLRVCLFGLLICSFMYAHACTYVCICYDQTWAPDGRCIELSQCLH